MPTSPEAIMLQKDPELTMALYEYLQSIFKGQSVPFAKQMPHHLRLWLIALTNDGGFNQLRYGDSVIKKDLHLSQCFKKLGPQKQKMFTSSIEEEYGKDRRIGIMTGDNNEHAHYYLNVGEDFQTCQSYNGPFKTNQCLLGYSMHGKCQLLAIWDPSKKLLIGRSILRLLLDQESNPVIHLEGLYGNISTKYKMDLYNVAKKRADSLGVPLVLSGQFFGDKVPDSFTLSKFNKPLYSRSCWYHEYVDSPAQFQTDPESSDEHMRVCTSTKGYSLLGDYIYTLKKNVPESKSKNETINM